MTQQEILEYNKRCALFLGAIDNTHEWGFMLQPNELNLSFDLFDEKLFSNDGGSGWFVKDLKFHSDWNWIMKVVEAIEKLKFLIVTQSNFCQIQEIGTKENNFKPLTIVSLYDKDKKEAVVNAINKFLTWYRNEETN